MYFCRIQKSIYLTKKTIDIPHKKLALAFLLASSTLISPALNAADVSLTFGGHDYIVQDKSSHTFGANIGIIGDGVSDSGIVLNGSFTLFIDHDKDDLDPDRSPYWFKSDAQTIGKIYQLSQDVQLDWITRFDVKDNTVSSIERQIKVFGGLHAEYKTSDLKIGFNGTGGYYFLETDDDVPKGHGYESGDYKNEVMAYSVMADSEIKPVPKIKIYGRIQQWKDGSQWLENQYEIVLNYDSSQWLKDSTFSIGVEHTQYNLEPYQKVGFPTILPWDDDTLVRVYLTISWK